MADLPNPVGDTINGPTKNDGSKEWTLTYLADADGSGYGLTVTVTPSDGC